MNQGQVIYEGASMTKSKGNLVEPMPLVERWGADTMRLTMLFANPFEDDIDWKLIAGDPNRRPGVHDWLGRVFAAVGEAAESGGEEPMELVRLTHRTIKGVTDDIERFRFNVAISKLMVLSNEMRSTLDAGGASRGAAGGARRRCSRRSRRSPPRSCGARRSATASGPPLAVARVRPRARRGGHVTLVVQVDGKVRDTIEVPADADEGRVLELARASEKARRAIADREVVKEIVRAPKLVNFVTR